MPTALKASFTLGLGSFSQSTVFIGSGLLGSALLRSALLSSALSSTLAHAQTVPSDLVEISLEDLFSANILTS